MAKTSEPLADRSLQNLDGLRITTKNNIAPSVDRVLKQHNVTTEMKAIGGTPCMFVYPPDTQTDWPILYGFGGGYVSGSPFEDLTIAAPIASITGAVVVIPHYRLAPEHPWPAAIDDGLSVYRELSQRPFAVVGESAGGNFCLALMLRAKILGMSLPSAAALMSPWCDLTNSGDSLSSNDGRDPILTAQHVNFAAKHYAGDNDLNDPIISPINGDFDETFPPTLITSGSRDLLMSQSSELTNILRRQGVSVDLRIWEDLWHVFEWDDQLPEAYQSISEIGEFLTGHMNKAFKC